MRLDQLNGIYRTLAKHHSFDPRFLARIKSAMELQPWKCACVRLNKKVALTCASCKWGYAPAPQAWQWDQITWPIRGTISRRSKRLGLKATDPQIRIEQIAPTNRIARIAQLKENQTLLAPKAQGSALLRHIADNVGPRKSASGEEKILLQSVPATTPASSSMSSAEEQLRTLTGMLRKTPDQLTPETQAYLTTLNVQATRTTAKSLHSAVSKLKKAQNGLTEVQGARLQLHCKWRNFVTEAVERWTQSTEDFKKEDQIEAQIQAAKDALPEIKEQYTQTHTQMGRKATAVEISDDEDNKIDAASAKISDGLQQMMGSLTHLKETADQMVEESKNNNKAVKRPCLGDADQPEEPSFTEPDKMKP